MRKLLTEFIGTFFLVFTVGMTVVNPGAAGGFAPIAIGLSIMIAAYSCAHISGCHIHPLLTIVIWRRGHIKGIEVPGYIATQLLAAAFAAFLTLYLKGYPHVEAVPFHPMPSIIAEIIGTFTLIYVVLNTAVAKANAANPTYGFAIGSSIIVMAYALAGVGATAFNPAVALGFGVLGLASWNTYWMYLLGEIIGTVLAVIAFRYASPKDNRK